MNQPDLYMVRVWHGDAGFRASARRVDQEQPQVFDDALELARFLADARRDSQVAPASLTPTDQGG